MNPDNQVATLAAPTATEGKEFVITEQRNGNGISEEAVRQSLLSLVDQNCCWGSKAAKLMTVMDIVPLNSYHCMWESYMEKRESSWKSKPYENSSIDSPNNGIAPGPWDMVVDRPNMFADKTVTVQVPHTEYVQQCSDCFGRGRVQCTSCKGRGCNNCSYCDGSGFRMVEEERQRCSFCNGNGTTKCNECYGDGMIICTTCKGSGRVVHFAVLTVEFINHIYNEVVDISGLPNDKIQGASGSIMCQQMGYRLLPPQEITSPDLQIACTNLFMKAEELVNANSERLIQQRVTVRLVPVTKARGDFNSRSFDLWIYGNDNLCYAPHYPQQTCCGCSTY